MQKLILILTIAGTFILSGCATYYKNKADKEFDNLYFSQAIVHYNKSLERKENPEIYSKLADACRKTNNIKMAGVYYAKAVKLENCNPVNYFYYAKILMEEGNYQEALVWFDKYLAIVPGDVVAKMLISSCKSVNSFWRDTTLFSLQEINMDKVSSMFGPTEYGNGIVFTADKEAKSNAGKNPWTGKSYLDLYFTQKDPNGKWISPQLLKGDINGQYHEGPATFNSDGTQVYFTRSNYYKMKLRKNYKNENNLKIFKATLINGKWSKLEELPFDSDDYSVGHPCLSPDGSTLLFVSDMPGGFGGTDIYSAFYDGVKWSVPMNLGDKINTPGNEMFPYLHNDGSLYFASDAHNSMGGLDVFVSSHGGTSWLRPENLNYPVNSPRDDFAFIMSKDDSTGFLSSGRSDTDKVYQFTRHQPLIMLDGVVSDRKTHMPLINANVLVINSSGGRSNITTDTKGAYIARLNTGNSYNIIASKEGYFSESKSFSTKGFKYSEKLHANFELNEMVIDKPIVLENIYYDLDKWEIRPDAAKELDKLVKILQDNPDIYIEMGSHTDSRAGDQYNLILSDKRAKATVQYLVVNGIATERLSWKGYGETKLLNRCKNSIKCSEEEHQLNRRTEFKVIRIKKTEKVVSIN